MSVNAAGQVAGYTAVEGQNGAGYAAWFYSPSTAATTQIGLTDALHSSAEFLSDNFAISVNAVGQVAGYAERFSGGNEEGDDAWVYDSRSQTTYSLFESQSSTGYAYSDIEFLSDSGLAVGYYYNYSTGSAYTDDAFAWSETGGFHDLGTLVQGGLTAAGWASLANAYQTNAAGEILGSGTTANGSTAAFLLSQQVVVASGMNLNSSGPLTVLAGGHLTLAGGVIIAPSVVVQSGGILSWSGGTFSGSPPITIDPGGAFDLQSNSSGRVIVRTIGSLTILPNAGSTANGFIDIMPAAVHANRQLVVINSITIPGTTNAWQGLIDLSDNDMNLPNATLSVVTNQIKEGYDNGLWAGLGGIISTSAATDTTHLTALGVIQNNQSGTALFTATNQFDGTTPGAGDILIKYTYYGDANLDGKVDGTDYSRIDNGYLNHLTGWFNGDFNYDGIINGSDYTLIDNAFNTQGASLAAAVAGLDAIATAQIAGGGTSAVPEPASFALGGAAALGFLRRRPRR